MKKFLFFFPLILLADVNPFNAGNLNSPNPYGLTPQEKVILQNKKNISKNSNNIDRLKTSLEKFKSKIVGKFVEYDQSISDLQNKLSAFNTILSEIDSTKQSIIKLKQQIKDVNLTDINNKISSLEERVTKLEKQNSALKQSIQEISKIQNQNFEYLSSSIQDILNQLKNINKPSTLSPKNAFLKARKLYFSGKLNKSKELFLYALSKKYLPATSSYYLGEIYYKQKNYKTALAYYKKSITLYPKKTSFTDRLLYHTGVSFEKINQKQNAKLTFKKLINDFPSSKYSKLAKKELEKL